MRIVQLGQITNRVPFYKRVRRRYELERLRRKIESSVPLNVVIGGGQTNYVGWVLTDRDILDITEPGHWSALFKSDSIDRILCEHVLEHLSEQRCRMALNACYRYLKPGGLLRVAVPDGYRRDPAYVAEASPPKDGHQVLYDIESLTRLLQDIGFRVTPLEYFDQREVFHAQRWDERDGLIQRSVRFDQQKDFQRGELYYTSLIVDARKPERAAT